MKYIKDTIKLIYSKETGCMIDMSSCQKKKKNILIDKTYLFCTNYSAL